MIVQQESGLQAWIQKEKAAIELGALVSNLWFDKSIELLMIRRQLVDTRASNILNHHAYAKKATGKDITIELSLEMAKAISTLELAPARLDLGRLSAEWLDNQNSFDSMEAFLSDRLSEMMDSGDQVLEPKDVVLFGFGRIGRLAARELIAMTGKGEQLRLKAIVTRSNSDEDIIKRASLMRKDSVHGKFRGTIVSDTENKALIINGQTVHMIAANDPANVDYNSYGINNALLIDNTGAWRDADGLGQHLKSNGINQVLLTAPGKGDIPNIVHGVNNEEFDPTSQDIWSAASCTTNAIVPVLAVIDEKFGIEHGHIETVHAYTNDQNLADNYHKKYRRGRAAALNMVITETGAAKAVSKVLPGLDGKMTGNAVRVPTPNVSLAILNLTLDGTVDKETINDAIREMAIEKGLIEQIDISLSNEFVSSDVVGNSHASVVDAPATIVSPDKKSVVLYVWYDNEYGYTRQVMRLSKYLANVRRKHYY